MKLKMTNVGAKALALAAGPAMAELVFRRSAIATGPYAAKCIPFARNASGLFTLAERT